jgi:hypothetical protein
LKTITYGSGKHRSRKFHRAKGTIDARKEIAQTLEPYARFDSDIERFCCTTCGYQCEHFRSLKAHIYTEHLGEIK